MKKKKERKKIALVHGAEPRFVDVDASYYCFKAPSIHVTVAIKRPG